MLARLATPADFGQFAAATVVVGVGSLLGESGMMAALINRRDRIDEAASTAFFSLLAGGVLLSLGAVALAPLVGLYYHSSRSASLCRPVRFGAHPHVDDRSRLAPAAADVVRATSGRGSARFDRLRRRRDRRMRARRRRVGLVAGMYASLLVQVVSAWGFARKRPRWREASCEMWRELSSFGRPVLGSEILRFVASQLERSRSAEFPGPRRSVSTATD